MSNKALIAIAVLFVLIAAYYYYYMSPSTPSGTGFTLPGTSTATPPANTPHSSSGPPAGYTEITATYAKEVKMGGGANSLLKIGDKMYLSNNWHA